MRGPIGVHAAHCCKWHGCKYGDPDCPVANREVEQEYLCEDCSYDLENEKWLAECLTRIQEIKKWQENKKCKS